MPTELSTPRRKRPVEPGPLVRRTNSAGRLMRGRGPCFFIIIFFFLLFFNLSVSFSFFSISCALRTGRHNNIRRCTSNTPTLRQLSSSCRPHTPRVLYYYINPRRAYTQEREWKDKPNGLSARPGPDKGTGRGYIVPRPPAGRPTGT